MSDVLEIVDISTEAVQVVTQGPQGATGPTGPAGSTTFGTTAGTSTEGNDARIATIGSGTIDTMSGGGSINTRGVGSIELGATGTRTTLTGTATADRAISLPNSGGTLALSSAETIYNITATSIGSPQQIHLESYLDGYAFNDLTEIRTVLRNTTGIVYVQVFLPFDSVYIFPKLLLYGDITGAGDILQIQLIRDDTVIFPASGSGWEELSNQETLEVVWNGSSYGLNPTALYMRRITMPNSAGTVALTSDLRTQTDVYTSNGTWTKPTGAKMVHYLLIGGGGGGGAGRRSLQGNTLGGGGGGAGGGITTGYVDPVFLGSTETITVGAGSAGAADSADNTSGATGTAGGDTSFGSSIKAKGGNAGGGGSSSSGIPGAATTLASLFYGTNASTAAGAAGAASSAAPSNAAASVYLPTGGGGGGARGSSLNGVGSKGGDIGQTNTGITSAPAIAAGTNGPAGIRSQSSWAGTGGGGGSMSSDNAVHTGFSGGNGGLYGGGGGGGSGAVNAAGGSTAGGTGGAGIVIVTTFF